MTNIDWIPDSENRQKWWETKWREPEHQYGSPSKALLQLVESELRPNVKMKAVDIASGNGRYAISMAKLGLEVDAIEWTESGVSRIKKNAESANVKVHCECSDFLALSKSPRYYDVVVASGLIEEIPAAQHQPAVRGILNWTAPGGLALIKYCLEIEQRGRLVADGLIPKLAREYGASVLHQLEKNELSLGRAGQKIRTGLVVVRVPHCVIEVD